MIAIMKVGSCIPNASEAMTKTRKGRGWRKKVRDDMGKKRIKDEKLKNPIQESDGK